MSGNLLGAVVARVSESAEFAVGTRHCDATTGKEYLYVQADSGAVTGAGYVVLVDESYSADMIDTTNSASGFGQFVGVGVSAIPANQYGWVQVGGVADVRVAASAAANVALNTTSTAGQIDDNAASGAEVVDGIVLTTANGGSAGVASGVLSNPTVGETL